MPRLPTRLLVSTLALIGLLSLLPALATALPPAEVVVLSATKRPEANSGLFSRIWSLLSALLGDTDTGSGLDPNGAGSAPSTDPNAATGDNGSGLDPNG